MATRPDAAAADVLTFRDAAEFEGWLVAHVDLKPGVWLKIAKKSPGLGPITSARTSAPWMPATSRS